MKQKYIIGLGCSWTQGEGGYPKHVVDELGGYTQFKPESPLWRGPTHSGYFLRKYELENSWVNQLCKYHFPDYKSLNLGIRGVGNEGAVKQLYFVDNDNLNEVEGIIILMLSAVERRGFTEIYGGNPKEPDGYSSNYFCHYKWCSIELKDFETDKEKGLRCFSEPNIAIAQMLNLLSLQDFVKANNLKLIVSNGIARTDFKNFLKEYSGPLYNKFNWDCYLHNETEYQSFIEKLVTLDGKIDFHNTDYNSYYNSDNLKTHSEYLTNDDGTHPTIKGYRVIADELAKFIKYKNYI